MPRPADDRPRCTRCKRPIRVTHYVYECDRGHASPVHRACREEHLSNLLMQSPPLRCPHGDGCTIAACRRSDLPDDPHAAALLQRSLTIRAREREVAGIFVALEDARLIALHIHFGLHQTWYDVTPGKRAEVDARVRAMVDAIPRDASFRRSVHRIVTRLLVGG